MFINDWLEFDQRLATATAPARSFSENPSGSSGSAILAMVASEKKRRRSSCHSSCCYCNWLPTNRTIAASLGKMPTTLVRLLMGSSAERPSRCDIEVLKRVGAPDLAPVLLREMQKRQYVVTGGFHHGYSAGELLAQHLGDLLPMGSDLLRPLDYEHRLWPPADFVYIAAATMS